MATYADLFDIANNNTLLDRMTAAVALQAEARRQADEEDDELLMMVL